jgi:ATP-binding cassette subfamily C protein
VTRALVHEVKAAFAFLSRREVLRCRWYVAIQVALALADLVGVTLLGLVTIIATGNSSGIVDKFARPVFGIADDQKLAAALGVAALVTFTVKGVLAILANRWILTVLAAREASLTADTVSRVLHTPALQVQGLSSQETVFAVTNGAELAVNRVVGQAMMGAGEGILLVVLLAALLLVNFWATAILVLYLGVVAIILQRFVMRRAARASQIDIETSVAATRIMQESLQGYRELYVTRRIGRFTDQILSRRSAGAKARSDQQLYQLMPKYVLELGMLYGISMVVVVEYLRGGGGQTFGALGVLLAGGFRLMPSILRLQTSVMAVRTAAPFAEELHKLLARLDDASTTTPAGLADATAGTSPTRRPFAAQHPSPPVEIEDVYFRYPSGIKDALEGVSLTIEQGERVALAGRSGSGKSTLADVMLGLLEVRSGSVRLFGADPDRLFDQRPGIVGYVPQSVPFMNGSVAENVALAGDPSEVDEQRVLEALAKAQLESVIAALPLGHWTSVGEAARRLSGGQRQRMGIARALYSRPRLLILDEATSALDIETERSVNETIVALGPDMTLLTIAHRPATIRAAGRVVVLDGGRVVGDGDYQSVRLLHDYLLDHPWDEPLGTRPPDSGRRGAISDER